MEENIGDNSTELRMGVLTENKSILIRGVIPHLIVWAALFAFPILFADADMPVDWVVYMKRWVPLLFSAFIFYLNYHFLINRFLFRDQITTFIVINAIVISVCIVFNEMIWKVLHEYAAEPYRSYKTDRGFMRFRNAFSFVLTSGFSVAMRAMQRWMRAEAEKKELENEHLKSEINHLRYQLQPHFFFNSLNTIYSYIDSAPGVAKDAVHGLAKLMRYVLYEASGEKIMLSREMEFLQNYIRLMQMRLPAHVKVSSKFQYLVNDYEIAPLLFVALIENAFKHGVSVTESVISIEMKMEHRRLHVITENAVFTKHHEDKSGSGIGLNNLMKRLELIYPGRFELKKKIESTHFRVELIIDL